MAHLPCLNSSFKLLLDIFRKVLKSAVLNYKIKIHVWCVTLLFWPYIYIYILVVLTPCNNSVGKLVEKCNLVSCTSLTAVMVIEQ